MFSKIQKLSLCLLCLMISFPLANLHSQCDIDDPLNLPWLEEFIETYQGPFFCDSTFITIQQFEYQGETLIEIEYDFIGAGCVDLTNTISFYDCSGNLDCIISPFFDDGSCAPYVEAADATGELLIAYVPSCNEGDALSTEFVQEIIAEFEGANYVCSSVTMEITEYTIQGDRYLKVDVFSAGELCNSIYQSTDYYAFCNGNLDCSAVDPLGNYASDQCSFWESNIASDAVLIYSNTIAPDPSNTSDEDLLQEIFPWLPDVVDLDNCESTDQIEVYLNGTTFYLQIEAGVNSGLYNQTGVFYCSNSSSFNCLEFYGLDELVLSWSCNATGGNNEDTGNEELLTTYLWLNGILGANSECEQITVYDLEYYSFVLVTDEAGNNGQLYFEDGTLYCTNSPGFSCVEAYNLPTTAPTSICDENPGTGNGENPAIFEDYPWLNAVVDPNDCNGTQILVYAFGSNQLLQVNLNGNEIFYLNDGTLYCTSSSILNCAAVYGLTELLSSWSCGEDRPLGTIGIDDSEHQAMFESDKNREQVETLVQTSELQMKVYPNPSNGPVFVELHSMDAPLQVLSLYDVQGRLMETVILDESQQQMVQLDLSGFNSGLYYVRVQYGDYEKVRRIVKR